MFGWAKIRKELVCYDSSYTLSFIWGISSKSSSRQWKKIVQALREMQDIAPHFISVTASNNKFNIEETTVRLADFIYNDLRIPTIAHFLQFY